MSRPLFIPAAYDDSPASWKSITEMVLFNKVFLHESARKFTNDIRTLYPHVFIIHRINLDSDMKNLLLNDQYNSGVSTADIIIRTMEYGRPDAFMSLCEPPCSNMQEAENLALFDAGFSDKMSEYNIISLIGGFGSGYPESDVLKHYLETFNNSRKKTLYNNIVLHFHCYGPDTKLQPNEPNDLLMTGSSYNSLRFQEMWLKEIDIPYPIIITESGPNGYSINPPGWKGLHTEQEVLDDSLNFIRSIVSEQVLGVSAYCIGDSGAGADISKGEISWENFNENNTILPKERGKYNAGIYEDVSILEIISEWKANIWRTNIIKEIYPTVLTRSQDIYPTILDYPPQNSREEADLIHYILEEFEDYKLEWELAGGLLDNFLTHLVAVGKFPLNNKEWEKYILEKIIRRRDSANSELRSFRKRMKR